MRVHKCCMPLNLFFTLSYKICLSKLTKSKNYICSMLFITAVVINANIKSIYIADKLRLCR